MKRSDVNNTIIWAKKLLDNENMGIPKFGHWSMKEWGENKGLIDTITKCGLGWDITDFGSGEFNKIGAVLFTLRNGYFKDSSIGTPYAEKLIMMKEGQELPYHFHIIKTEDIINRGGGVLEISLFNSLKDKSIDFKSKVRVYMDGIEKEFLPGEKVAIEKGNSITLSPYIYHRFSVMEKTGDVLVGEVSSINDDFTDNYFLDTPGRFSEIEEDEEVLHPLSNEYDKIIN